MHATRPFMEDATVRYVIDTHDSTFVVQAFSAGLLSAFAHSPRIAIRDFNGDLDLVRSGATLQNGQLNLAIQADSLEVADDIGQKDREEIHTRMCNEVLETERFPEIVYKTSRVTASGNGDRFWAVLSGDLTLHGVTRSLPVSAKVLLNGDSLRASGEFSLRQSDYGITLVSAAGGTIRVKDELKFTFDIAARRRD
ncbi:MAG TPA: YceI family protein [Terriglobales bacterium]|nr:YceI family protein [Terriglobales bacterium]